MRVSVGICFFTDLVDSGAHWWWFNPEKLLQIRLLPALVLWLQKSEEAAAMEINHGIALIRYRTCGLLPLKDSLVNRTCVQMIVHM